MSYGAGPLFGFFLFWFCIFVVPPIVIIGLHSPIKNGHLVPSENRLLIRFLTIVGTLLVSLTAVFMLFFIRHVAAIAG